MPYSLTLYISVVVSDYILYNLSNSWEVIGHR